MSLWVLFLPGLAYWSIALTIIFFHPWKFARVIADPVVYVQCSFSLFNM